jgi:hypothetical protein
MVRCPGQDQRFWKPEDIFEVKCPACGGSVEFFKDEPKLKCRKCGELVDNPKIDLGCAEWCHYAEQCLGVTPGGELNITADKLKDEMKEVFFGDEKRIEHTLSVLSYAEQIWEAEGGDPMVVKAAAILHDIGIVEAERKYGSSEGKYQQTEGPIIARGILEKYSLGAHLPNHRKSSQRKRHRYRGVQDCVGRGLARKYSNGFPRGERRKTSGDYR